MSKLSQHLDTHLHINVLDPEALRQAGSGVVIDMLTFEIIGCYEDISASAGDAGEFKERCKSLDFTYETLNRAIEESVTGNRDSLPIEAIDQHRKHMDRLTTTYTARRAYMQDPRPVRIALHNSARHAYYEPLFEIAPYQVGERLRKHAAPYQRLHRRLLSDMWSYQTLCNRPVWRDLSEMCDDMNPYNIGVSARARAWAGRLNLQPVEGWEEFVESLDDRIPARRPREMKLRESCWSCKDDIREIWRRYDNAERDKALGVRLYGRAPWYCPVPSEQGD
ncbi:hypothetical protein M011DRAFT_479825 [Sporormia fimetaria CBS 119925]|uniref:Uncharacterized protein n=1 Tax=Sporormia fimetaria CBS 119925 TaxID=1340428 RepID=A0A6A6V3B8_9PLEO|nr:hypothetical protein M011DRAFT_479825 [Sporormia fimetaria CBS 119925]